MGLLIQFFSFKKNSPKITCKLDDIFDSYWISGNQLNINSHETSKSELVENLDVCVVSLIFSNKRNSPITIDKISISSGLYLVEGLDFIEPTKSVKLGTNKIPFSLYKSPNLTLPFRMESNDSVHGSLIILCDKNDDNSKNIVVTVDSSYKSHKFNFQINSANKVINEKRMGAFRKTYEAMKNIE